MMEIGESGMKSEEKILDGGNEITDCKADSGGCKEIYERG